MKDPNDQNMKSVLIPDFWDVAKRFEDDDRNDLRDCDCRQLLKWIAVDELYEHQSVYPIFVEQLAKRSKKGRRNLLSEIVAIWVRDEVRRLDAEHMAEQTKPES